MEAFSKDTPADVVRSHNGKLQRTTSFFEINDKFYNIEYATCNITTKNHKIDREKTETWEKLTFIVDQRLQVLHSTKIFSKTLLQPKFWACSGPFKRFILQIQGESTQYK